MGKDFGEKKMSSSPLNWPHHSGSFKSPDSLCPVAEIDEIDFFKALDRPSTLNLEKQKSFEERSLSELSLSCSPHQFSTKADNGSRLGEHFDNALSPLPKSSINTPRSFTFDPQSILPEAWESLRRSLVHFRGEPVGTIAALDNSDEKLNYDQVM